MKGPVVCLYVHGMTHSSLMMQEGRSLQERRLLSSEEKGMRSSSAQSKRDLGQDEDDQLFSRQKSPVICAFYCHVSV